MSEFLWVWLMKCWLAICPFFLVSGCLVVPGLIDLHVHCYEHVTPLGIDVDKYSVGRGVTTVVDAGRLVC